MRKALISMLTKLNRPIAEEPKIFYFHTPKTGGTSVNSYFTSQLRNSITHVESHSDELSGAFLNRYRYVSGHLSYSKISQMLDDRWIKIITFREPYAQVVSHLSWVRRLADEGQEGRLRSHPEVFQKIALKMKSLDFSQAGDIHELVDWLKSLNFNYFFNTQIIYLDTTKNLESALSNLYDIDFIGIAEESDIFFRIMDSEFCLDNPSTKTPRENINLNKYGFDLDCGATRIALVPFLEKDLVVYNEARHIFSQRLLRYGNDFAEL